MKDKILNSHQIIKGVKPIKNKPTYNDGGFDKTRPLGAHNYPLSKYTNWEIYGYKKDKLTGIKRPYWLNKTLPTGQALTAQIVGLDGFYNVKPKNQVI